MIGVTDTSVVSIADQKTHVIGTGRIGNPSSHTFAIYESGAPPLLYYVDTTLNNMLIEVNLHTGEFYNVSQLKYAVNEMIIL